MRKVPLVLVCALVLCTVILAVRISSGGASAAPRPARSSASSSAAAGAAPHSGPAQHSSADSPPRPPEDAQPRAVVLSPHHDDAVYSAWAALESFGPSAEVVVVYGGAPAAVVNTSYDRHCGFPNSAAAQRSRERELRQSVAQLGTRVTIWPALSEQYRRDDPGEFQAVVSSLRRAVREHVARALAQRPGPERRLVVLSPALRSRVDYEALHEAWLGVACEALAANDTRVEWAVYEDYPYVVSASTGRWSVRQLLERLDRARYEATSRALDEESLREKMNAAYVHSSNWAVFRRKVVVEFLKSRV
eukprot:m51a1_g1599 hypothetical protein (305) ;mRNA; f:167217-168187